MQCARTPRAVLTLAAPACIPPRGPVLGRGLSALPEAAPRGALVSAPVLVKPPRVDASIATVRSIARAMRNALAGVKPLALTADGRAELTLNIADTSETPISKVLDSVLRHSSQFKVTPVAGLITGLIPEAACERQSDWMRQLIEFDPETKILERRLGAPLPWPDEN